MRVFPLLVLPSLLACSAPQSAGPSLAPRAAEAIDPRVPIPGEVVAGPADPALAARIAELLAEVRSGDAAFQAAAQNAEALAANAGPAQSESWIVAQEALSGLVATRGPVTKAIADLDALAGARIAAAGGILPGDLAAIEAATSEAAAIGQRQAEVIDRLQVRLAG
jgi:hypothetical protein